jgi:sugar lactone lactonase YvrE
MNDLEHFLSIQNELGETPIWVPEEDLLYWVDFIRNTIFRIDVKTKMYESLRSTPGR